MAAAWVGFRENSFDEPTGAVTGSDGSFSVFGPSDGTSRATFVVRARGLRPIEQTRVVPKTGEPLDFVLSR